MISILKRFFPNGIEYGDGVVCAPSPFTATLVLDFYDGAIEGFSKIAGTDSLIYFRKIWWDERQNNRLFDGVIFSESELEGFDPNLCTLVKRGIAAAGSVPTGVDSEEPLPPNLMDILGGMSSSTFRVNIFCVQITRELFILPLGD